MSGAVAPSETAVSCRTARAADARAVRLVLPEIVLEPYGAQCFVAEAGEAIVGVAGLVCRPYLDPVGFRFALKVIEPHRRCGVGRALLRAVAHEARRWGVTVLWPWLEVDDGPEAAFLIAMGARVDRRALCFEGDAPTLNAIIPPLARRVRDHGRARADLAIVPLAEAPIAEVAALHRRYLGGTAPSLVARLMGQGSQAYSAQHSVVMLAGGTVAGAVLCGWEGDVARIDAVIVTPAYRRTWASVLLLDAALAKVLADGPHRVRFWCWDDAHDSMKLGARANAVLLKTVTRFRLDLE